METHENFISIIKYQLQAKRNYSISKCLFIEKPSQKRWAAAGELTEYWESIQEGYGNKIEGEIKFCKKNYTLEVLIS